MPVNFHRDYALVVAKNSRAKSYLIPSSIANPKLVSQGTTPLGVSLPSDNYIDFNSVPSSSWEIKGVQLKAKITQTKTTSSPCQIEVTNGPLEVLKSLAKDDIVILKAGYKNSDNQVVSAPNGGTVLPNIFVGQITQIVTNKRGADWVTKILAAEAITIGKNVHISKAYLPGTTRYQVLLDLIEIAGKNGLPLGALSLYQANYEWTVAQEQLWMGYSVKGMLLEELETFCESIGLNCYTVLGKLYIEPKYIPTKKDVFFATSDQVIGDINVISDNTTTTSNESGHKDKNGVQVKFWLDGRISVDKLFRLKGFNDFDGDYLCTGVVHDLDFRSTSAWTTSVTLQNL